MVVKKAYKPFFWIILLTCLLIIGGRALSVAEQPPLVINEFVAANQTGLLDEDGDYSDWIELYNASDQPLNLSGFTLTDDLEQPQKWTFPDMTLASGDYLLLFASGKNRRSPQPGAELHTNFRLNREQDFLGVYNILDRRFVDQTEGPFPPQFDDTAYGRYGDRLAFGYLERPTPGQPNDATPLWQGITPAVQLTVERGFFEEPFSLALSAPPEATIRYTTDGTPPTEANGQSYTEPLLITSTTILRTRAFKPDFLPSEEATHTYIFLDDVLSQSTQPPGFPATWGTHSADYKDYVVQGTPMQADYEMDPDVVNDPAHRHTLPEDLRSIASLSLVMDGADFTEVYSNPMERGVAWERPVSVELIDPQGEEVGFQTRAGIRIQGGWGRWEYMPKHSFRLFFKRQYGPTKLNYPLFPDSPVEQFDTVVLRAGVRSYAGRPDSDHASATYTRDEWLRASQIVVSGVGSHGRFVHLYINGLYWGLYNVVERPDASFAAAYLGGVKEDWLAANHSGPISGPLPRIQEFQALMTDLADPTDPAVYQTIQAYLDTAQFSDYIILNWYAGNGDWPDDNWYLALPHPEGPLRFFVWDGEGTWDNGAVINLGRPIEENMIGPLFELLIQNPDFKMEFADRLYKHLFNDGALSPANAQARWLDINAEIERAIVGELARWGDTHHQPSLTYEDWLRARDNVLAQMSTNNKKLLALTREAGYYPPVDPPRFNQQGGVITPDFQLSLTTDEAGTIYYTTDGSDPRQAVTGGVADSARTYTTPLLLTGNTLVKSRLLVESRSGPVWSALNEATFRLVARPSDLRLTEIMYNPPGGGDYEFIELQNLGTADIELSGLAFEGIRFVFPPTTPRLAPGQTIVLVRNPAAFEERYPDIPFGGIYEGQLSNAGETLTLRDQQGQVLLSVTYDDDRGWPISADGRGDSLVVTNLAGDPNDPRHWQASPDLYGTPGQANHQLLPTETTTGTEQP